MSKTTKNLIINTIGKRKTACASATLRNGTGLIRINGQMLDMFMPKMARMKISEPLFIAGADIVGKINIDVKTHGGGIMSQTEAARLAIARALNEYTKDKLREDFVSYDRNLLVADTRRKEAAKPNCHGKARSKVQKSYR